MYTCLHVKYPLFLSHYHENYILRIDFRKILKYQISRKSVHWEPSCSIRTDRQTDMMKLTVAFRNFVNAPNNSVPTSQRTQSASITETNLLMLLSEIQNCWYSLRYLQLGTITHHFTVGTLLHHINGGDAT